MKKLVSIILIIACSSVFSQSKMNFELIQKLSSSSLTNTKINVFVKGNIETIKTLTANLGGNFKYSAGDIAVLELPENKIKELALANSIIRMEAHTPHIKTIMIQCLPIVILYLFITANGHY